jgi:hypothetical protein
LAIADTHRTICLRVLLVCDPTKSPCSLHCVQLLWYEVIRMSLVSHSTHQASKWDWKRKCGPKLSVIVSSRRRRHGGCVKVGGAFDDGMLRISQYILFTSVSFSDLSLIPNHSQPRADLSPLWATATQANLKPCRI